MTDCINFDGTEDFIEVDEDVKMLPKNKYEITLVIADVSKGRFDDKQEL